MVTGLATDFGGVSVSLPGCYPPLAADPTIVLRLPVVTVVAYKVSTPALGAFRRGVQEGFFEAGFASLGQRLFPLLRIDVCANLSQCSMSWVIMRNDSSTSGREAPAGYMTAADVFGAISISRSKP